MRLCVCVFSTTLLQRAISFKVHQLALCGSVSAGHLQIPAQLHPALYLTGKTHRIQPGVCVYVGT